MPTRVYQGLKLAHACCNPRGKNLQYRCAAIRGRGFSHKSLGSAAQRLPDREIPSSCEISNPTAKLRQPCYAHSTFCKRLETYWFRDIDYAVHCVIVLAWY